MRAILVSVDYADLLSITLPYNRHHFELITVVTTPYDQSTRSVCKNFDNVDLFVTNAFYDDGAVFNKWKALEQGLDHMGREGWLCIMDADVLWPKQIPPCEYSPGSVLYTPRRRMYDPVVLPIPSEDRWTEYPLHPQQREFAGYTQIFHAEDPVLGPAPWHETNWRHAGGADSFFQAKWENDHKVRPPFEVLHLGGAGQNWCGRATPYLDGTIHPEATDRQETVRRFIRGRKPGLDRFSHEKL